MTQSSTLIALIASLFASSVYAHTVFMCIKPGENQITAYAGTYHTNSQVGGMIIAGGVSGNEQYDPICPIPYPGYSSGVTPGEFPCSGTCCGKTPWGCGQRFNWETTSPMTYAQLLAEAPDANCDQVGNSGSYYSIGSSSITWNRVVIPVNECGENINYGLVTTADNCDDTPWMNVWAQVECVPGDPTQTPNGDPECSIGVTCPADITVSANGQCQATVDVASLAQVSSSDCTNVQVEQDISLFGLGSTEVTVHAHADGGFDAHCNMHVTVVDTQGPILTLPTDAQVECDADVSVGALGSATATDNCPGVVVTQLDTVLPGTCPQEQHIQRLWTATDAAGQSVSGTQHISVVDTKGPVQVTPEETCLWPPNHKFKCFDVESFVTGTDNCGSVSVAFTSCGSDQPENDTGDGNFLPDCYHDPANNNVCFRAERKGDVESGRTYFSTFLAQDQCGNTASFARNVFVPHDEDSYDVSKCEKGNLKLDKQNGNASSNGKRRGLRSFIFQE